MTIVRSPRAARAAARRGFSLVEGLLGLAIFAGLVSLVTHWIQQGNQEAVARGESTRWVTLTKAADNYVKSQDGIFRAAFALNPSQKIVIPLSGKAGTVALSFPNPPAGLTLSNFVTSGVVGANFQDGDLNNSSAALVVYKPGGSSTGDYEAVMVGYSPNGKPAIDDKVLVRAEAMSENRVGAYLANDPTVDADGATGPFVRGPRGGWRIPVADLQGTALPVTAGHMFSYVTMEKRGQNDDSRYLVRTPDANHDNNSMMTNLDMHGYTVYNVYSLCGTTGAATQVSADPTADCSSATQIKVGGDLVSNAGFYGAGSVESDTQMVAPVYYQGTTAGPNLNFYLKPAGTSVLNVVQANTVQANKVQTNWFDIDACAYSSKGDRTSIPTTPSDTSTPPTSLNVPPTNATCPGGSSSTIRLSDLFPKEVVKGTFVAYDGNTICQPGSPGCSMSTCGTRADGSAVPYKVYASFTRIFNRADPGVQSNITLNRRPVMVVTSVSQAGNNNISVTNDTVQSVEDSNGVPAVKETTRVTSAAMVDQAYAVDNGNGTWTMHLPSIGEVPQYNADGTPAMDGNGNQLMYPAVMNGQYTGNAPGYNAASDDQQNQAIVQVACSYQ